MDVTTPLQVETIAELRAGDLVQISGVVYGARDAAHQRMVATLTRGEALPVDLAGQMIYYVGPAPAKAGQVIGPAGPTTSGRMDPYTLPLLAQGVKGFIGKRRCWTMAPSIVQRWAGRQRCWRARLQPAG
jgi:fumarate hydratase subunit beta